MRSSINLAAGLANSAWSALVGLVAVPFYLKYLGIEAYGLIGFFVTIQSLLALLDFGLAPTINREVARASASGDLRDVKALLRTLGVIYWAIGIAAGLMLAMLAPAIADHWLQSKQIPRQEIVHALTLMGLVTASRWPVSLYHSVLVGSERLVISSVVSASMLTLGSIGGIGVLAFVSPSIGAFLIWQAAIGLVYLIVVRMVAWASLGGARDVRFDIRELRRVWRFSAGMSAISLSGIILTQMDRIVLSRTVGLEDFGHYTLATTIAGALYLIIVPVFNVIYPRLSALTERREAAQVAELYRVGTRLLAGVVFPAAMFLGVFAKDLVLIWTGRPDVAASVAPILGLLAVSAALHAVMHFPYALQLANGMTRLPVVINAVMMVISPATIVFFSLTYGVMGGAVGWLLVHVIYVLIGTRITHRYLLKGVGTRWLLIDVGIPLALSAMFGVVAFREIVGAGYSPYVTLILGALLALSAAAFSSLSSYDARSAVCMALGWKRKKALPA